MADNFRLILEHTDREKLLDRLIAAKIAGTPARVYEAGGGSRTILADSILNSVEITVVDISPEQTLRCKDVKEAIVGNIETWRRPDYFNLACCVNVLEHVDKPKDAISSMVASLADDAYLVIAGPLAQSLASWVIRFTPHAFHVWFYRKIRGNRNAGKPGHPPFPVRYAEGSDFNDVIEALRAHDLEIVMAVKFSGSNPAKLKAKSKLLFALYKMACGVVGTVTLGAHEPAMTDFMIIAEKRPK